MDAETVKAIKAMQEQINDLVQRMDENFIQKHNQNSEAIDDIVVSIMYERLKRLYDDGRITQTQLRNAVDKGWITAEEYAEIVG